MRPDRDVQPDPALAGRSWRGRPGVVLPGASGAVARWDRYLTRTPGSAVAIGLVLTGAALALKAFVNAATGGDIAYLALFAILPVSVLLGGFGTGAVVVLAGVVLDAIVFHSPVETVFLPEPALLVRLVLFIPVSLWIAWLVASLVDSRRAAALSARRLAHLLDGLPDMAMVVDPITWRIEYANQAMLALGGSGGGPVGQDLDEVLPGLRDAVAVDGEMLNLGLRTQDEDDIPVEVQVRSVQLPSGDERLLVSAHDLRARIEAEVRLVRIARAERAQAQALNAVIASMEDGVGLIAGDGRMTVANEALVRIAGGPVTSAADLATALRDDLGGGMIQLQDPSRWFELTTHDLDAEAAGSRLIVVRDITRERESAEARDAFLGVLSHELRTPVTTILGTAHLLRRPRDGGTAPANEMVGDIAAEAERLNHLIEDLLVLSRAQAGAVAFEAEPVLVQHAIREVVATESTRHPHVDFAVDIATSLPPINGDRTYVVQVLRNLIGNAAKYGPLTATQVQVVAGATADEVVVRILDQGPGFDPDDAQHLFEIFYRAARTARARSGSGIGLYVTRTLVEAMGGRVWATLRETRGSDFGFALPIAAADESDGQSAVIHD